MLTTTEPNLSGIPCAYTEKSLAAIAAINENCTALFKAGFRLDIETDSHGNGELDVQLNLGPFKAWIVPDYLKREEGPLDDYFLYMQGPKGEEVISICDTNNPKVLANVINDVFRNMKKWAKILNLKTVNA